MWLLLLSTNGEPVNSQEKVELRFKNAFTLELKILDPIAFVEV